MKLRDLSPADFVVVNAQYVPVTSLDIPMYALDFSEIFVLPKQV